METNDMQASPPAQNAAPVQGRVAVVRRIILLFRTTNLNLRSKLAREAGKYPEFRTFIEARLNDNDPRVRANLIESIWGIRSAACRSILRRAAADPHPRVRCNALVGLCLLRDPSAVKALRLLAGDPRREFRVSAAWAMGRIKNAEFLEILQGLSHDPEQTVRDRAAAALSEMLP